MILTAEDKKARMKEYLSRVCGGEVGEVSEEDLVGFEMLVMDLQRRFLKLNLGEVLWEVLGEELP